MTEQATNIPAIDCTDELDAALLLAQAEFTEIEKDKWSQFHQDHYASLESILRASRPALITHGLLFTHEVESTETGVRVSAVLRHVASKQVRRTTLLCDCGRVDPQKIGSAITYLRKYTTYPTLGLAPDEDDDGHDAVGDRKAKNPEQRNGQRQRPPQQQRSNANGGQQPPPKAESNFGPPPNWPDKTTVDEMKKWIDGLKISVTSFKVAWGILFSNETLRFQAVEEWEPVLEHFKSRIKFNVDKRKDQFLAGMSDGDRLAFFSDIKKESDRVELDKQGRDVFGGDQPEPAAQGTESDGTENAS